MVSVEKLLPRGTKALLEMMDMCSPAVIENTRGEGFPTHLPLGSDLTSGPFHLQSSPQKDIFSWFVNIVG